MSNVLFQFEGGGEKAVSANPGDNLLNVARGANVAIDAPCSGNGACGKCRVKLVAGELESFPTSHISQAEFAEGWRLACMSKVQGDVTVMVPDIASAYQSRMKTADLSSGKEIAIFEALQQEIRDATADLPCEVEVLGSNMMDVSALYGSGAEVVLYGNDLDALREAGKQVVALMESIPGIENVSDGQEGGDAAKRIVVDKDAAMRLGLTVALWGCGRESRGWYDTCRTAALTDAPPYLVTDTPQGACKQRGSLPGFYTAAARDDLPLLWSTAILRSSRASPPSGRGGDRTSCSPGPPFWRRRRPSPCRSPSRCPSPPWQGSCSGVAAPWRAGSARSASAQSAP